MAKPKRGSMKDIHIDEISLVDLPANKQPFLFFKQKGSQQIESVNKATKIEIGIVSDGTVGGTKVSVNDDDLENLRSFDFSFYGDDPKATVHASYSKVTDDVDGFSRTETYFLSKGEIMSKELLKKLQEFLGTDEIDFEKKIDEKEVLKALTLITKEYQETFPEDLENAVGVIAKCAARSYNKDVEKAGAKFSKDVIAKLKAIIAAVEALLPSESKESKEKSETNEEPSELAKQVAELTEAVANLNPEKKDNDKVGAAELKKALKEISERVQAMETDGVEKKSITGDETKEKGTDEVRWPSFQPKKD